MSNIILSNYNTNNNDFSIITVISVNKCFLINQDYFSIQTLIINLSNELDVTHSEFNYSELIISENVTNIQRDQTWHTMSLK